MSIGHISDSIFLFSPITRRAAWLKGVYDMLPRKYKKNLKKLYILHPTFWVKSFFFFVRPFISSKFWRKVEYVKSANEVRRHQSLPDLGFICLHTVGRQDRRCIFASA